jgi:hypothetical protein
MPMAFQKLSINDSLAIEDRGFPHPILSVNSSFSHPALLYRCLSASARL